MKNLRLAYTIIGTLMRDQWYYRGRLVMDLFLVFARCGILLILYAYVFRLKGGVIGDANFAIVAWSIFFYFALATIGIRNIARVIMQDVRSGVIETIITKPVSYIFYRMMWQCGSGIGSFAVIGVCGSIVLNWWVGIPETMTIGIFLPTLGVVFVCCIFLQLIIYTMIGFAAFWIEDVNPIFWLVDKTMMILGGSYLPIALFPDFLHDMAMWSPFGAAMFVTHTVNATWQIQWHLLIPIQLVWIGIGACTLYLINQRAQRRLFINGG